MHATQKKLTDISKLFILSQNHPKSLPNNEKQLLPLKMSDRKVPAAGRGTRFPNSALIDNSLQEVVFGRVYV